MDGTIYINGEVLGESYGREVMKNSGMAADPITLGDDEYFVLGDNRNDSTDSRDPSVGVLHKSELVARLLEEPGYGFGRFPRSEF